MFLYRQLRIVFLLLFACFFSANVSATQLALNEDNQWQTYETSHFIIHFTAPLRDWAIIAGKELESAHALLLKQQNRQLTPKVQVLVIENNNQANGFAISPSYRPLMTLFVTPPQSNSLSNAPSWQQLLTVHEYVHLVHLGQPSRNKWLDKLRRAWDLFDVSQSGMPRWVAEGYATLMESKLTGRGRLFDDNMDAFLSQLTVEGAFPQYRELNARDHRYMAGSFAYIVGARFMYWLEQEYGADKLDHVWTRSVAVKKRNFDQAFKGVYNASAQQLYRKFVVAYTQKTLARHQELDKTPAKLWLDLNQAAHSPAISPSGEFIALLNRVKKTWQLSVFHTKDNQQAQEKFAKQQEQLLKRDPLDIADVAPEVFKRQQKASLPSVSYWGISNPVWLDNQTLLFTALSRVKKAHNTTDIYSWNINTDEVKQHTLGFNIRRFDVINSANEDEKEPHSITLFAEQATQGYSQIIAFNIDLHANSVTDLASTRVSVITDKQLGRVYDFPQLSPDNTKLAYLKFELNNKWQLYWFDRVTNQHAAIPLPHSSQFLSYPQWSLDGQAIYFTASQQSLTKLFRVNVQSQQVEQLTSGDLDLHWPTQLNDNTLLAFARKSTGQDIVALDLPTLAVTSVLGKAEQGVELANVDRQHVMPKAMASATAIEGNIQDYGLGVREGSVMLAATVNWASYHLSEIGYRNVDLLQRLDWQINATQSSKQQGLQGVSGNLKWRTMPVDINAHGYYWQMHPDNQGSELVRANSNTSAIAGQITETGVVVSASQQIINGQHDYGWQAKYFWQQFEQDTTNRDTQAARVSGNYAWHYRANTWRIRQRSELAVYQGNTDSVDWQGYDANLSLFGQWRRVKTHLSYQQQYRSPDDDLTLLSLGGAASNLIAPHQQLNRILAPELPFMSLQGNKYQNLKLTVALGEISAFSQRHKLTHVIDSFGLAGNKQFNFGLPSLVGLNINYGLARVLPQIGQDENQLWLSFFHRW
ncbi:hypothetical protein C2869_18220 [Saccharobesus litoralis]|uniref:Uncharacterized protein n=1 Tax=Saccharobesus litoralis TaxID=2172099 RepID=A0A2S0VVI7_9ALTE|nr:hypothetical protein [Saccharobesus litoralis]AWB68229.1 hypothetical protein C2869_18220 [Saccharobesus litoralis]